MNIKLSVLVCRITFFFCTLSFFITGEIIETRSIKTMLPFINRESLIFLNIDGVLYAPFNELGGHRWKEYFSEKVKDSTDDQELACKFIDQIKNQIINKIPKKNIEEIAPRLIDYLQENKIVVLGMIPKQMSTSYAANFAEIIRQHLFSLNIHFEKTLKYLPIPKVNKHNDGNEKSTFSFAYGIVFTNRQPIGPTLLSFLKKSGKQPINVVVIDHSREALESAQESFDSAGISFTGILYGDADDRKDLDLTLGTVEFLSFIKEGQILSDKEALQTMPQDRSLDYDALLDKYIEENLILEAHRV